MTDFKAFADAVHTDPEWLNDMREDIDSAIRKAMTGEMPGWTIADIARVATQAAATHLGALHDRIADLEASAEIQDEQGDDADPEWLARHNTALQRALRVYRFRLGYKGAAQSLTDHQRAMGAVVEALATVEIPDHPTDGHGLAGGRRQEIPPGERRPGDRVTLVGTVKRREYEGDEEEGEVGTQVWLAGSYAELDVEILTVTREVPPLPTTPGEVGRATVRGLAENVKVMRSDTEDVWFSAVAVEGEHWHPAKYLTDYVPELEGRE